MSLDSTKIIDLDYQTLSLLLPSYDGNRKTLHFYIQCVEKVLDMVDETQEQSVSCLIRNKLTGKAIEALSEQSYFKSWLDIKNILIQRFGESRSELELVQELIKLNRNKEPIDIFADKIRHLTYSLIHYDHTKSTYYEQMAINVVLDQVSPMVSVMVRTQNPKSLEQVLGLVKAEENRYFKFRTREREQPNRVNVSFNPQPSTSMNRSGLTQKPYQFVKKDNKQPLIPAHNIKQEKINFQELEDSEESSEFEYENFQENQEENSEK